MKKELQEVMDYVIDKMGINKRSSDYSLDYEETDNKMELIMTSRSMEYYEMNHMDATDDICGLMEYYEDNMPSGLKQKIDGLNGQVGEKGFFCIYVYKNK